MSSMIDAAWVARYLPEQRWFGAKGSVIKDVEILDHGILDDGPPQLVLALARVIYSDGSGYSKDTADIYHLPLLVDPEGDVHDLTADPGRLAVLGELMAHGLSIKGESGVFNFSGASLDPMDPPGSRSVRLAGAEQTNTSLVLDDQYIVKIFRRVVPGPNPDLELSRLLTTKGFDHIPGHAGEFAYESETDDGVIAFDLGVAQPFLPEAVDGWVAALGYIRDLYDAVHPADVPEDIRVLTEERAADVLESFDELGEASAALHIALSREESEPDLVPEEIAAEDIEAWAERALFALEREADLNPWLPAIRARIERVRSIGHAGLKTRIHGDYHLGQVILSRRGWMIIDFEGEPARTLDERRAKQSPLRDVAGMIRSFSYAALAVLFERAEPDSPDWERLEPWSDCFEQLAGERFLNAYLRKSYEGTFLPPDRSDLNVMLDVFMIDKALYELAYERNHRPAWVRIPLKGIARIAEREA